MKVLASAPPGTEDRVELTSCSRLFNCELMVDCTEAADMLPADWNA